MEKTPDTKPLPLLSSVIKAGDRWLFELAVTSLCVCLPSGQVGLNKWELSHDLCYNTRSLPHYCHSSSCGFLDPPKKEKDITSGNISPTLSLALVNL